MKLIPDRPQSATLKLQWSWISWQLGDWRNILHVLGIRTSEAMHCVEISTVWLMIEILPVDSKAISLLSYFAWNVWKKRSFIPGIQLVPKCIRIMASRRSGQSESWSPPCIQNAGHDTRIKSQNLWACCQQCHPTARWRYKFVFFFIYNSCIEQQRWEHKLCFRLQIKLNQIKFGPVKFWKACATVRENEIHRFNFNITRIFLWLAAHDRLV